MVGDDPKGSSVRSSTEKVIRYKLDGSPCLKPGPKPKKLAEGNSETSQLISVNTGRSGTSKGKPGPKPKKPAAEISEVQDTSSKTDSLASKGGKTSCERTEEMSMSPKNKSSPKGKKDIANIRTEQRKKPGPKPRKALSEPVKIDLSIEDASKIKEGAKTTKQQVENVNETPNSQTSKGKPKTKSKKNVTEDSEITAEHIKGNPKIPIQELNASDDVLSSQKVRRKPGPKPKKMPESSTSVGGSPATAKKKVSAKRSMSGSGDTDDSTHENKDLVKGRKTESNGVEKRNIHSESEKKKTVSRSKKVENEAEGSNLSKSKGGVKAKSGNINVETSFPSAKFSTKSKNTKNDTSPVKGKPGPKPKRSLPDMIRSTKLSPSKLNTESPKRAGKKFKKSSKRPLGSSTAEKTELY